MAFDPDQYLAEKAKPRLDFDADAYLAAKAPAPVETAPAGPSPEEQAGDVDLGAGRAERAASNNWSADEQLKHDVLPQTNPTPGEAARGFLGIAGAEGAGLVLGKAAGALQKFVRGAGERTVGRVLENIEAGGGKLAKAKMRAGDAVANAVREEPAIAAAAGDDVKLASAASKLRAKGKEALQSIYRDADGPMSVEPSDGVPQPVAAEPMTSQVKHAAMTPEGQARIEARLAQPRVMSNAPVDESLTRANVVPYSLTPEGQAATRARLDAQVARGAGGPGTLPASTEAPVAIGGAAPADAIANMDASIAKLAKGTDSQRAQAKALQSIRDGFAETHGETSAMPTARLRAEQSDYQAQGYGKAMPGDHAGSARIEAYKQASKDVGDVVVRQVTGMGYDEAMAAAKANPNSVAGRLFKANDQVKAAAKLDGVIRSRAGSNPGAPFRGRALIHGAVHGTGMLHLAGQVAAGNYGGAAANIVAQAAYAYGPKLLPALDRALARIPMATNAPAIEATVQKLIAGGVKAESVARAIDHMIGPQWTPSPAL